MTRPLLFLLVHLPLFAAAGPDADRRAADLQTVLKAPAFTLGPVGISGAPSVAEFAFWNLHFLSPDRKWIDVLHQSRNRSARAYAATSLYLANRPDFIALLKTREDFVIPSRIGCCGTSVKFSKLEEFLVRQKVLDRARAFSRRLSKKGT